MAHLLLNAQDDRAAHQVHLLADRDSAGRGVMMASTRRNETRPVVSVVVPAYMAATHVHRAVESVLAQTFEAWELLVVNDGSPDTPEMEDALAPYAASLTYILQANGGPATARNTGIEHARGEFVAFLDADDAWDPDFLERQLALLRKGEGADLVYSDARIVGDDAPPGDTYMRRFPSVGSVTLESLLRRTCNVITSSVVVRRSRVMAVGSFDPAFRGPEDYDLWLRLAHDGARMRYQTMPLITRYVSDESLGANPERLGEGVLAVLRKLGRTDLTAAEQAALADAARRTAGELALLHAKRNLEYGRFAEAITGIRVAYEARPRLKLRLALYGLGVSPELVRWVHQRRNSADELRRVRADAARDAPEPSVG